MFIPSFYEQKIETLFKGHLPLAEAYVDLSLLDEYEETLRTTWVVILKNVFSKEHLNNCLRRLEGCTKKIEQFYLLFKK